MEKFPGAQPIGQSPEELHELDIRSHKELEAVKESIKIWGMLERKEEPAVPTDKEDAERYIEKLEFLKEHNTKQYDPLEKRALYNRVDAYIEKLKGDSQESGQETKDEGEDELKMAA